MSKAPVLSAPLLLIVAASLLLHASTMTRFPAVWLDEVFFTDPALNLAWQGHLTSTGWYFQDDAAFWAANVPLYPVLLAGWIKLFGYSEFAARSFNLCLAGAATMLLMATVRRLDWLKSTRWTAWFGAFVLCAYGMSIAHRSMRYDALGLLLCSICLWSFTLSVPARRWVLAAACMTIPWAGFHVAVYVTLLTVGCLVWRGRSFRWDALLILSSLSVGLALLAAVLHLHDALSAFLLNVRMSGYGATIKAWPRDPSLLLLLVASGGAAATRSGRRALLEHRVAAGWLCAGVVAPVLIFLASRLPVYYAWMAAVPLALGSGMLEEAARDEHRSSRWMSMLLLAAVCAGLPVQTAITLAVWQQRDPAELHAYARRVGIQGKVVLVDPELFYPARQLAAKTYFSMYDFELTPRSRAQRAGVVMMLVAPETQPELAKRVGGLWEPGEIYDTAAALPAGYGWLARHASHSLFGGYRLQVFRRQPTPGESPGQGDIQAVQDRGLKDASGSSPSR